jgi:hypothetical protein
MGDEDTVEFGPFIKPKLPNGTKFTAFSIENIVLSFHIQNRAPC